MAPIGFTCLVIRSSNAAIFTVPGFRRSAVLGPSAERDVNGPKTTRQDTIRSNFIYRNSSLSVRWGELYHRYWTRTIDISARKDESLRASG
jgi:hypothetical protein